MTLPILYADNQYIAINKPPGMAVHRSSLVRNTDEFALQNLRNQIGQQIYPIHRLDRPTSGVLVFAFSSEAAACLAKVFGQREVQKNYFAIVRGFPPLNGQIHIPLQNNPTKQPQNAQTNYRRLAYIEIPIAIVERYPAVRYALLNINPLTGRMHQIRKHFNRINHPIIGDYEHGDYRHNRFFAQQLACPQLFLHAHSLNFKHPYTHLSTHIKAPFPDYWLHLCTQFGWLEALKTAMNP